MTHPKPLIAAASQSFNSTPIATAAQKARQLLLCCLKTNEEDSEHFATSQLDRFDLWASNIGVFAALHASLDYRLRTAVAARAAVEGNLEILCEQLLFALTGQEELRSQDLQVLADAKPQDVVQFGSNIHELFFPDLRIHRPGLSKVESTITILHQLSLTIRKASNRNTLAKAPNLIEFDNGFSWVNEHHGRPTSIHNEPAVRFDTTQSFEVFVHEVLRRRWMKYFPGRDVPNKARVEMEKLSNLSIARREYRQTIFDRCVSLITARRQQLAYFQSHQAKLASPLPKSTLAAATPSFGNLLTPTPQFQLASTNIPKNAPAFFFKPAGINLNAALSDTLPSEFQNSPLTPLPSPINAAPSTAPSSEYDVGVGTTRIFGIPPPPEFKSSEREKACPYCCLVYPAKIFDPERTRRWRKHLMEDLQPYPCLFKNCGRPGKSCQTFKEWQAHLNQQHYQDWQCPLLHPEIDGDTKTANRFSIISDFTEHLATHHPDLDASTTRSVVHSAGQPTVLPEWCFICLDPQEKGVTGLLKHIEKHLRQAFLLALPCRDDIEDSDVVSSGRLKSETEKDNMESFRDSDSPERLTKKKSSPKDQEKSEKEKEMDKVFEEKIIAIKLQSGSKDSQSNMILEAWTSDQHDVVGDVHAELPYNGNIVDRPVSLHIDNPEVIQLPRLYPIFPADGLKGDTTVDIIAVHGIETISPRTHERDTDPRGRSFNWLKDADMLPSVVKDSVGNNIRNTTILS